MGICLGDLRRDRLLIDSFDLRWSPGLLWISSHRNGISFDECSWRSGHTTGSKRDPAFLPFGLWKPIREEAGLSSRELSKTSENATRTLFNVVLGMLVICGAYLFPMYLVGHWYSQALIWLILGGIAALVLKFTWYDHLPQPLE